MLLDPGPLGLHSSIIWKPSIAAVAAIAEPFLSAIAAITAIVAIIWKPSFKLPKISKTTTLRVHHAFLHISLPSLHDYDVNCLISGLSAGNGKLCIFGHLGLVFIWSCFVSCLLLLLYYVICAPVLTEGTLISRNSLSLFKLEYFS